jgi:hypothetical protein
MFVEVNLESLKQDEILTLSHLQVSLLPTVNVDDFDFNVSLNEEEYLGADSKELKCKGKGIYEEPNGKTESFTFEGPVDDFKLTFAVKEEIIPETGVAGKTIKPVKFDFDISAAQMKVLSETSN